MTILEWLIQNNVHRSIIDKGKAFVVMSVNKDDKPDTIITDQNTGEAIFMKKINDLNTNIDLEKTRLFVIGAEQWKKMTTKNLFLSKLKQDVVGGQ